MPYCGSACFQKSWTLLTVATTRQASFLLASAPVLQLAIWLDETCPPALTWDGCRTRVLSAPVVPGSIDEPLDSNPLPNTMTRTNRIKPPMPPPTWMPPGKAPPPPPKLPPPPPVSYTHLTLP